MTAASGPTIGIALGGGGAKGFAHLGVLKALRGAGIEVDVVAGTSIGALVGAVYAAGSLEILEFTARSLNLKDIPLLMSPAWSKQGFFSGNSALELFNDLIAVDKIEALSKKFAAVSVDMKSGTTKVFTEGDIHHAVRASISIPALFTPVLSDDCILVDGGLLEPVPVEICRSLGADIVIAVDLFGPEASTPAEKQDQEKARKAVWPAGITNALNYLKAMSEKLPLGEWIGGGSGPKVTIIDIVEGTLALSQRQLTAYRLRDHPPDILIQPEVNHVGLLDFHRGGPVIDLGEQAARRILPDIQRLLGRPPRKDGAA